MSETSMTPLELQFVNALAERLDAHDSAFESYGDLGGKIDDLTELTKSFDFGSELAQLKSVIGQVCQVIGLQPAAEAAPAIAAEGGMEKGSQVVTLGDAEDSRKKDGLNFAAELMPIAKQGGLVGILTKFAERMDALETQGTGRTAAEATGEPIAKSAPAERPLFQGRF